MGFAAVSCSRHWTAVCDVIQSRADEAAPYLYGALALVIVAIVAASIYGKHEAQ